MTWIGSFGSLLAQTFREWNAHKIPKMGAALSFYAVVSLAPLALIMLSLVSLAMARDAVRMEIVGQFRALTGNEQADMVQGILTRFASPHTGLWGTLVGFIVMVAGAAAVFDELQDSLNQIWEVTPPKHRLLTFIKERILSLAMVLGMGFLMLVSFLSSAIVAAAGKYLHGQYPLLDSPLAWANSAISLLVIAMLFALIYRLVPSAKVQWRDVWLGSSITAILFVVGKVILGFYFGRSAISSSYGAAGSLIIILGWVYYSAQILYFGAAFTHVYALKYGSHVPSEADESQ